MEDTITTTYYLCEEFLKATGHRDDPQVLLSTAEVMTIALVSAAFFGGNIEASRSFLDEYGYIPKAISKSRFNRRLHAIDPSLWQVLFDLLAEVFKQCHPEQTYVVDSLPVAACDNNIRIRRSASSIPHKSMAKLSAATLCKQTPLLLRFAGASGDYRGRGACGVLPGGSFGGRHQPLQGVEPGLAARLDHSRRQGLH
ncbi:MAG: hypothetical protein M3R38_34900, partial [Actinomycetota bacterium]|nr:hypothetical protein [Actinomycetota bacterium]